MTIGVVNNNYSYNGVYDIRDKTYQNFISEVFVDLVGRVNTILNEILTHGTESVPTGKLSALHPLLLYAKEASELSANALAERYYLEVRINKTQRGGFCYFRFCVVANMRGREKCRLLV